MAQASGVCQTTLLGMLGPPDGAPNLGQGRRPALGVSCGGPLQPSRSGIGGADDGAIDDEIPTGIISGMKGRFTAIIEEAPEGGYWAICPEVPGANGQGETIIEAKKSLRDAIRLLFEDRVADARRGLPDEVIQTTVAV